jgi:hypothetical protein
MVKLVVRQCFVLVTVMVVGLCGRLHGQATFVAGRFPYVAQPRSRLVPPMRPDQLSRSTSAGSISDAR